MSTATFYVGDVRKTLALLPDQSVDLVLSSPPFLALRSYLPADHPDKALEMGSEATPADYLDALLDVVEDCARVLAAHGSLVFELGDTFAGSGGAGGDYGTGGLRDGQERFDGSASKAYGTGAAPRPPRHSNRRDGVPVAPSGAHSAGCGNGWPLDKSLCGIPTLFAWSLAYGRNLLRPERTTEPWRIRNLIVWARPNPPVGALGDKFRPATSYLTVACKARDRYFDLDAVRVVNPAGQGIGKPPGRRTGTLSTNLENGGNDVFPLATSNPAGAPPLDYFMDDRFAEEVWELSTESFSGSHYATWPRRLCELPIKAMCPQKVCTVCGKPSRRVVGEPEYRSLRGATSLGMREGVIRAPGVKQWTAPDGSNGSGWAREAPTLGWSDCGHDSWRPGVVLDPFAGSGTTGSVASGHGRNCLLVDLDERNAALAIERIGGLFCEVSHLGDPLPTWLQGTPPAGV